MENINSITFLRIIFVLYFCINNMAYADNEHYKPITVSNNTNYTPEEIEGIKKLRNLVKEKLYRDYMSNDEYLIRWLRARNLNVNAAAGMLEENIKWRKANGIDSINKDSLEQIRKQFNYWLEEGAWTGGAVLTAPAASWNVRRIMLAGQRELIALYMGWVMEECEIINRELNVLDKTRNITQGILIIDLSGYANRIHGCLACIPFYSDLILTYEKYFPQLAEHLFLINTPRVFQYLLEIIRPIMSKHTREVFKIYGLDPAEYRAGLARVIKPDTLKVRFGGNKF